MASKFSFCLFGHGRRVMLSSMVVFRKLVYIRNERLTQIHNSIYVRTVGHKTDCDVSQQKQQQSDCGYFQRCCPLTFYNTHAQREPSTSTVSCCYCHNCLSLIHWVATFLRPSLWNVLSPRRCLSRIHHSFWQHDDNYHDQKYLIGVFNPSEQVELTSKE